MTFSVETRNLSYRFGDTTALDSVNLSVQAGTICGLLGRNGAGKSTLLANIAAFRRPSDGQVLVDGENPWEHPRIFPEICLIRELGDLESDSPLKEAFDLAAEIRPRWDGDYAAELVEKFGLDIDTKVCEFSRGQRSAAAVIVGLASRAPLTMFDEPHLGMDAPSRTIFYDELLADYIRHPRTVVVSTHLIDEIADLLEDVIILDRGRVLLHRAAHDLRVEGTEITGPTDRVDAFTAGLTVIGRRSLGPTSLVAVLEHLDDDRRRTASTNGLELGPIGLQDLFVHLTAASTTETTGAAQ